MNDTIASARTHSLLLNALVQLRTELMDQAFDLEQRAQFNTADFACQLAVRLEKIVAEASAPAPLFQA
jgi:hypothetical protein